MDLQAYLVQDLSAELRLSEAELTLLHEIYDYRYYHFSVKPDGKDIENLVDLGLIRRSQRVIWQELMHSLFVTDKGKDCLRKNGEFSS